MLSSIEFEYIKNNSFDFLRKQVVALAFSDAVDYFQKADYDTMFNIMSKAYKQSFGVGNKIGTMYCDIPVIDRYSEPPRKGVWSTGFSGLDNYLDGGFAKKECVNIVSATGRGKTSLLTNFMVTAMKAKKRAVFVTLEMSEEVISQRMDSILLGSSATEISRSGELQVFLDEEIQKYTAYKPIIKYFVRGSLTSQMLRNYLDRVIMDTGPLDIIIVDWIGCMKLGTGTDKRHEQLAEAADDLVNMSREYEVTMLTSQQTNRSAVGNDLFGYGSVSESFSALFGMDIVLGLGATDKMKDAGSRTLNILKSRVGPDSVYVKLRGDLPGKPLTFRFTEAPKEEEEGALLTEE
jgi:replicative DNA helicase